MVYPLPAPCQPPAPERRPRAAEAKPYPRPEEWSASYLHLSLDLSSIDNDRVIARPSDADRELAGLLYRRETEPHVRLPVLIPVQGQDVHSLLHRDRSLCGQDPAPLQPFHGPESRSDPGLDVEGQPRVDAVADVHPRALVAVGSPDRGADGHAVLGIEAPGIGLGQERRCLRPALRRDVAGHLLADAG